MNQYFYDKDRADRDREYYEQLNAGSARAPEQVNHHTRLQQRRPTARLSRTPKKPDCLKF